MIADCPEHIWEADQIMIDSTGATVEETCIRCGALDVELALNRAIPHLRPEMGYRPVYQVQDEINGTSIFDIT